ncbi:hypothetical protein HDU79_008014 [Rhizoclosmatium sp. JEL0117]|nr:hypothetical protein HDU79_008014 [Rhizoclosmatium sp. JEL0117]
MASEDWSAQTLAALKGGSFAMLSASVGQIVQHALGVGTDAAKEQLAELLVSGCCLDASMPQGVLVAVLPPVIDTLVFLLSDASSPVLKRALQQSTAFFKLAFKTIATIPLVDVTTWVKLSQLKATCKAFSTHQNLGVRSYAIKFLQTVVLAQSYAGPTPELGDVSLDLVPPNHPYLFPQDLQRESLDTFNALLLLLNDNCPSAIMTASINSLFPIIKTRPSYSAIAVQTLIQWIRTPPTHLSSLQLKNVQRSIRNEFLAILGTKLPEVAQFIPVMTEILVGMGVKGYEIAVRVKARDQGAKRMIIDDGPLPPAPTSAPEYSSASGYPSGSGIHQSEFDVQSVPLNLAVDLVVQVMAMTPQNVWIERLTQFGQTLLQNEQQQQGFSASASDPRRRDPRMKEDATEPSASAMDIVSQLSALQNQSQIKPESLLDPSATSSLFSQPYTAPQQHQPQVSQQEPEFDPLSVPLPPLSTDDAQTTWKQAITRILDLEPYFDIQQHDALATSTQPPGGISLHPEESVTAARNGWMLLLVRLLASSEDMEWGAGVQELRNELLSFILSSFRTRYELAVLWLHEEYHLAVVKNRKLRKTYVESSAEDSFSGYDALFHQMLFALKEGQGGLDAKDRTFTKFLIDVPLVTTVALDQVLKSYCEDSERMLLGFSSLRDLILLRPAVRDRCVDTVLAYCVHPDKIIRSNAILLARRWISPDHAVLGPIVEKYATETLLKLCGPPPSADDEEGEDGGGAAWEEIDSIRHFELYFALSSKKHSLLSTLFTKFSTFLPEVTSTILHQIDPLIRSMANSVTALCTILRTFPKGAESLVRKVVDILTEREPLNPEVVSTVIHLVVTHDLDGTWILKVLSGLDKNQILQFLPKLIALLDGSEERERLVEAGLVKIFASDQDPTTVLLPVLALNKLAELDKKVSPVEVLMAIHNMEGPVDLKCCLEGTKLCIKHPEIFKQEVLAIVIQQLVDQQKIPTLFMRTVLETIKLFPNLANFINSILTRLITKRVWVNPNLWKGFIICCKLIAPTSFSVIITLPKPQMEDILNKEPGLKPQLYEYVLGLPSAMTSRVRSLLPLLEDPHQMMQGQQRQQWDQSYSDPSHMLVTKQLDLLIQFGEFLNIEVYRRGFYQLQCRVYFGSDETKLRWDASPVRIVDKGGSTFEGEICTLETCQRGHTCTWRCSSQQRVYRTKMFKIEVKNEVVQINSSCVFSIELPAIVKESSKNTLFLEVDLYFADMEKSMSPTQDDLKFQQSRRFKLSDIFDKDQTLSFPVIYSHTMIQFDGIFWSACDMLVSVSSTGCVFKSNNELQEAQAKAYRIGSASMLDWVSGGVGLLFAEPAELSVEKARSSITIAPLYLENPLSPNTLQKSIETMKIQDLSKYKILSDSKIISTVSGCLTAASPKVDGPKEVEESEVVDLMAESEAIINDFLSASSELEAVAGLVRVIELLSSKIQCVWMLFSTDGGIVPVEHVQKLRLDSMKQRLSIGAFHTGMLTTLEKDFVPTLQR